MNSAKKIELACDRIKKLLLDKNAKYGDAALNPSRIMSKSSAVEQILVRIDDKLSRIQKGAGLLANDEDVVQDLCGYFILLMIALENQYPKVGPEGAIGPIGPDDSGLDYVRVDVPETPRITQTIPFQQKNDQPYFVGN
jgi:hypothetical protein